MTLATLRLVVGTPVSWTPRTMPTVTPATVIPWKGHAHTSGAFLLSRVNLNFLNMTCSKFTDDLKVATQVASVLIQTKLIGSTVNQVRRYGFIMLKLETEFKEVLDYLTALLLCSGRGGELWQAYSNFRKQTTEVWKILKEAGLKTNYPTTINQFPDQVKDFPVKDNSESLDQNTQPNALMSLLETARPLQVRQPRSPILVGLGLGFLGNFLLGSYFGNSNNNDIETLNTNIQKTNQNIRVTNERIDILAKNVSNSVHVIKNILDKLVKAKEMADIHYAIQWNLDQLVASITNVRNTFKFGELTITLLKKGIINAELIDLKSFQKIITEGRKSFPELDFPLDTTRYQLKHIIKILKIQSIGHLKFMMIIPLTRKDTYTAFSLIPHPVKLGSTDLVLPELKEIILINKDTYIITNNINVYSISLTKHLLLDVEPIYNKNKKTCEWEGFKGNTTTMMEICNYKKVGQTNDTFVVETDQHRLVYFSERTRVSLDCPKKQVRDTLFGLHKLPLACDIKTDQVFWPAKQTVTISLEVDDTSILDSTSLPIISINKTDKLSKSLKELLDKLPNKDDSLTIDFDYLGLSLEKVQSYTIYAQSIMTVIIILNSLLIGYLLLHKLRNRKQTNNQQLRNKFKKIRDSIRSGKKRFNTRESFRNSIRSRSREFRDSIKSRSRELRNSIRSRKASLTKPVKNINTMPTELIKNSDQLKTIPVVTLNSVTTGTNTADNWQPPPYNTKIYPMINRYS